MAISKKARRLDELAAQIRVCTRCPLWESRTLAVPGEGRPAAKVMIIGEAPGKEEDETGRPFIGATGRFSGGDVRFFLDVRHSVAVGVGAARRKRGHGGEERSAREPRKNRHGSG